MLFPAVIVWMLSPLPHAARLSSQFFHLIEFAGVALGALGGAMVVRRDHLYRYDFIGILGLGLISGVGGGIARDILLGDGPPLALLNPIYLALSIGGAGLALFFSKNVGKHLLTLMHVIDAAGLGLFTIAGATRAQNSGLGFLPCLLLGVTTAVGGGSLRDVFTGRTPQIFQEGELYALVSAVAAAVFLIAQKLGVPVSTSASIASFTGFILRLAAVHFGWRTKAVDEIS